VFLPDIIPALGIFCRSSTDRSSLEPTIRSHRAEARVADCSIRNIDIDVLVWVFGQFYRFVGQVCILRSSGLSARNTDILTSRAVCGAFNGGNGIVKSVVMDIVDTPNLPSAYGYMPLPFMLGTMLG
jgi:hypothetical protein